MHKRSFIRIYALDPPKDISAEIKLLQITCETRVPKKMLFRINVTIIIVMLEKKIVLNIIHFRLQTAVNPVARNPLKYNSKLEPYHNVKTVIIDFNAIDNTSFYIL